MDRKEQPASARAVMLLCVCLLLMESVSLLFPNEASGKEADEGPDQPPEAVQTVDQSGELTGFDSYLLNCSGIEFFTAEELERYYGEAAFCSISGFGGNIYEVENMAGRILESRRTKRILVQLGLVEAVTGHTTDEAGRAELQYYLEGRFAHPQYSREKLSAVQESDNFSAERGTEGFIGAEICRGEEAISCCEQTVEALERVKKQCEQRGVEFLLILPPASYGELIACGLTELEDFWVALAEVTDFWDFTGFTSDSFAPGFFYDDYDSRSAAGDAALAQMVTSTGVNAPQEPGVLITAGNVMEKVGEAAVEWGLAADGVSIRVPILLYHSVDYENNNALVVAPETFHLQMTALKEGGYTAVFFADLINYVEKGIPLPEKPVVITFDDGYLNNYEYAMPILRETGMKATVHVIGISVGRDTYKETGEAIYPHFSAEQGKEMLDSGVIDLQSHSFDMHQSELLETDFRRGVLQKEGESEGDYIAALQEDFRRSKEQLENMGAEVIAFSYPQGYYSEISEAVLAEEGVRVTLTVKNGVAEITRGVPQSLMRLERLNITERDTAERLLERLEG